MLEVTSRIDMASYLVAYPTAAAGLSLSGLHYKLRQFFLVSTELDLQSSEDFLHTYSFQLDREHFNFVVVSFRRFTATMSSCDCDRKDSNGGTCDSSCKEESFGILENSSSPMSFAPVLAVTKAAGAVEVVSFEGSAEVA